MNKYGAKQYPELSIIKKKKMPICPVGVKFGLGKVDNQPHLPKRERCINSGQNVFSCFSLSLFFLGGGGGVGGGGG